MVARSRHIQLLAAILIVVLFLQGCSAGAKPPQTSEAQAQAQPKDSDKAPVTVTIGYQSPTAQTWGALIIKNKKLYEKHLKELAPDQNVKVEWFDAPAGSILNNNMNSGKIQISFLGDMPSLLNGVLGITQPNYHSVFLAFDGKGVKGRNQAILVPKTSNIKSIADLKGKTVSTPIGSSSHRMLLESLRKHNLVDQVTIVDQSVTVGMQSIEQDKIAAHSTWEPYPSLIQQKNIGTVLQFGEETQIDYLAGVVANADWAKANKPLAVAFLRALNEAHEFAVSKPEETAKIFEEESKFPPEVTQKMVKNIRFDAAIYEKDLKTLDGSIEFLAGIGKLAKRLDLKAFVDDGYLREALKSLNKPYLNEKDIQGEWIDGKVY